MREIQHDRLHDLLRVKPSVVSPISEVSKVLSFVVVTVVVEVFTGMELGVFGVRPLDAIFVEVYP